METNKIRKVENPLSIVYNMDCVEGMKQFPDKFFDLAICDPPYGIHADDSRKNNLVMTKHQSKNWDINIPSDEYFQELFRVSKNQIIWGGNYFHLEPTRCWLI